MKLVYIYIILAFFNLKLFGQENKLLITFSPNNCGTLTRNVNKLLNNDSLIIWVMEETYKGHKLHLGEAFNINFNNNVIYSDSLFNFLSKDGPSINVYSRDSLIFTIPQVYLNTNTLSLIVSVLSKPKKIVKQNFSDEFWFSNNTTIKMKKDNYIILDNIYNQVTYTKNGKNSKINGKDLFSGEIYYNIFKEHYYFDSIMFYQEGVKEIGYNTIQIKNVAFTDSLIALLCGIPTITRLEIDLNKIAVLPNPALILLDSNLKVVRCINLSPIGKLTHLNKEHHFSFNFFDYYNGNFYVNFTFHRDSIFDQRNKLFGVLSLTNSNELLFRFSNISLPKPFWPVSSHVTSYLIGTMPFFYSTIMPLQINFEKESINYLPFEAFSLIELQNIFSSDNSNRAIFVINSIYQDDDYLQLLYSKNRNNYKEIYDLKNSKVIFRHKFDDFVIKERKSNVLPTFWNRAIYLNNNNELVEIIF
jgi:hypothetical protein